MPSSRMTGEAEDNLRRIPRERQEKSRRSTSLHTYNAEVVSGVADRRAPSPDQDGLVHDQEGKHREPCDASGAGNSSGEIRADDDDNQPRGNDTRVDQQRANAAGKGRISRGHCWVDCSGFVRCHLTRVTGATKAVLHLPARRSTEAGRHLKRRRRTRRLTPPAQPRSRQSVPMTYIWRSMVRSWLTSTARSRDASSGWPSSASSARCR